jgi:hypothetical protein
LGWVRALARALLFFCPDLAKTIDFIKLKNLLMNQLLTLTLVLWLSHSMLAQTTTADSLAKHHEELMASFPFMSLTVPHNPPL